MIPVVGKIYKVAQGYATSVKWTCMYVGTTGAVFQTTDPSMTESFFLARYYDTLAEVRIPIETPKKFVGVYRKGDEYKLGTITVYDPLALSQSVCFGAREFDLVDTLPIQWKETARG